jgi:hypothetical protein
MFDKAFDGEDDGLRQAERTEVAVGHHTVLDLVGAALVLPLHLLLVVAEVAIVSQWLAVDTECVGTEPAQHHIGPPAYERAVGAEL